MIWIIVPLSRPANIARVRANIALQNYPELRVCVVENGAAVGACRAAGWTPDLVLHSKRSAADAKNVGVDAVRAVGGELWACFDDDDYYGPEHLVDLAARLGNKAAVARRCGWMNLPDGLYFFDAPMLLGATVLARVEHTVRFRDIGVGEDIAWFADMRAAGHAVIDAGPAHFLYDRAAPDHTWRADPVVVRRNFGPADFFGPVDPARFCAGEIVYPVEYRPRPTDAEVLEAIAS